VGHHNPFHKP